MVVFYRRSSISTDGYYDATLSDVSDGNNTSVFVSGGVRKRQGWWNIKLADRPSYGSSEMVGARLYLYPREVELYSTPTKLDDSVTTGITNGKSIKLYKAKDLLTVGTDINEGDVEIDNVDILQYSSTMLNTPLWVEDFTGSVYHETADSASVSFLNGVKTMEKGKFIYLSELAQAAHPGSYSKTELYAMYATRPTKWVGSAGPQEMGGYTNERGVDSYWGRMIGDGFNMLDSYDKLPDSDIPEEPDLGNAQIIMEPCSGWESPIDSAKQHGRSLYDQAVNGGKWVVNTIWGSVTGEDLMDTSPSYKVKNKWKPKYGNQVFTNDVFVYEDSVNIKNQASDVIDTNADQSPTLTAPDPKSFVKTSNTVMSHMRKTPNLHFKDAEGNDSTYDIAQSNIVFHQETDTQSCLMENIYAFTSTDATPSSALKSINSSIDYLQETRMQTYIPAPLNMWPEDMSHMPHPYIDIPIRINLPPAFAKNGETLTKTRMRRALFVGFNRYPLSEETDFLHAYNSKMRAHSYGIAIYRSGSQNDDKYYTVVPWHGLNLTDASDPYFNDDGDSTGISGYLSREEVEDEYFLLRFSCTWDGIKAQFLKPTEDEGFKSILLNDKYLSTASGSDAGIPYKLNSDTVGVPYVDITGTSDGTMGASSRGGLIQNDGRSWSQARKYHIKSGFGGTRGSTENQLNMWSAGMGPNETDAPTGYEHRGIYHDHRSATLPFMWAPYLTIASTNTRYNGNVGGGVWPDGDDSAEHNNSLFPAKQKDAISRIYIDSITPFRFNYSHANASINSGNTSRSALTIPAYQPYTFCKISPIRSPIHQSATGVNEENNLAGVEVAESHINYTYISLGFKNKADIEGAQKWLMFNGYQEDIIAENPRTGHDGLMYSCESEPMGEFHWRAYNTSDTSDAYLGLHSTNWNSSIGQGGPGAGGSDSFEKSSDGSTPNTNQGLPIYKYSFFGGESVTSGLGTPDAGNRSTASGASESDGFLPFQSGLQTVSGGAAGGYDATGVNRVEGFEQKGLLGVYFNDDSEDEIGQKVWSHPNGSVGYAGQSVIKINASPLFKGGIMDLGYNNSTTWGTSTWHAGFGFYEKTKGLAADVMPDYTLPNLNWMMRFDSDTTTTSLRNKFTSITAIDASANCIFDTAVLTSGQYPVSDDTGRLFPGFFVQRENPFAQGRICTSTFQNGTPATWEIEIDSDNLLNNSEDEIYIVYQASQEWIPTIENNHNGSGMLKPNDHGSPNVVGTAVASRIDEPSIKRQNNRVATLVRVTGRVGSKYLITECNSAGVLGATDGTSNSADMKDSGSGTSYSSGTTGGKLENLLWDTNFSRASSNGKGWSEEENQRGRFRNSCVCISPYRYWLYIRVPQQNYEKSFSAVAGVTSSTDSDFSQAAGQADCAFQSTYNESQFTDAKSYNNKWNWNTKSPESHVELSMDFGYGSFDGEKGTGGYLGRGNVNQGAYNRYSIDGLVRGGADASQEVTIFAVPYQHEDVMYKFDSAEGTNPPYLLSVYADAIPQTPSDFKVKPDEESAFYPRFTWETQDDDLWYGFLIVDSKPIKNQYHNCVLHVPLNESEPATTTTKYYRPDQNVYFKSRDNAGAETQSGYMTVSGSPSHTVEGLAGNSFDFDGTDDYLTLASTAYTTPSSEMTINLHVRPDAQPTTNKTLLEKQYEYSIQLDTNSQIIAKVWADTGSSGTSTDIPVELKSISALPCDKDTPSNVILVVDAGLKYGNVKLYIDGKLEDQSGLKKDEGSANNWTMDKNIGHRGAAALYIGRDTAGAGGAYYDGKMEEITIYNQALLPVTPSDGQLLFTKPVSELSTATEAVSKSYGAKLFIKDYHNIRGVSRNEVCSTSQISFRKAAFRLNTT